MIRQNTKIAIIGSSGSITEDLLKKAHQMGIETHCFSNNASGEVLANADNFYNISIFEKDAIVEKCKSIKIDGVLPTTELTIPISAYISEKLNLNGNSYELMSGIVDKQWVRNKNDVFMQPCYYYLKDRNDSSLINIDFPLVVKPAFSGGKIGLTMVKDNAELANAVEYAFSFDKRNAGILIEEYISGKEYSVEVISFHGVHRIIQITEKISEGYPHCAELGHSQPANISDELYFAICDLTAQFLSSVEYSNGPSHIEIKVNEKGIYLIEINARPGGDYISSVLTPLSTGYDYLEAVIDVCLNREPADYSKKIQNYCGIRFITSRTKEWTSYLDRKDVSDWLYRDSIDYSNIKDAYCNNDTHDNYFIYCSKERLSFLNSNPELRKSISRKIRNKI